MFMSIGVVIAATVIYFKPTCLIADPLCTFLFSIIVIFTVRPIISNCISVLMEGTPAEIDTEKLIDDIKKASGSSETEIHDFHLWSISMGKFALSAHINCSEPMRALKKITELCREKYSIDHVTL